MFHIQTANDQYRLKEQATGFNRSTEVSARYLRRYQNANQAQPSLTEQLRGLVYTHIPKLEIFDLTEQQSIAFDEAMLASCEIVFDGIFEDS